MQPQGQFTQANRQFVSHNLMLFCRAKISLSFKQVRNSGDIAATKSQVVYARNIELSCNSEHDKNCAELPV